MERNMKYLLVVLVLSVVMANAFVTASSRRSNEMKSRGYKHPRQQGGSAEGEDNPGNGYFTPTSTPQTFDILSFGAKGDGVTDDSKALLAAWRAACVVPSATIQIPSEFKFLIRAVTLRGPCMPNLVLQIDGTLLASSNLGDWSKSSLLQWVNFKWLHEFAISGNGMVDGHGSNLWSMPQVHGKKKRTRHMYSNTRPTALRFYKSCNVTVRDIKILNSPQCHLKFDSSEGIKVQNITISSPGFSPNTDGIHLQDTKDVEIEHSDIGCGDDCISIQTGCSNVHIHHVNCAPGHGISLGSLGKDKSLACVSNVTVEDVSIQNALYGVRIKTWQGGFGLVHNVTFSGVQVFDVDIPIVIDQYYCNKRSCKNQSEAVVITGVKYKQITGTYTMQPMHIACGDSSPCTNLDLIDIQLSPSNSGSLQEALCWKSYGESQGRLLPSNIGCLQKGNKLFRALDKSHKYVCSGKM